MPSGRAGARDRLDRQVDHAVAAADDEGVDPVRDALSGQVEGLRRRRDPAGCGRRGPHRAAGPAARSRTLAPLPLPAVGLVRRAISLLGTRADYRSACQPTTTDPPEAYGVRAGRGTDGPGETADRVEGGLGVHPRPGHHQEHAPVVRRRPAPRRAARPGARAPGSRRPRPAPGRRRRRRGGRTAAGRGPAAARAPVTRCPVDEPALGVPRHVGTPPATRAGRTGRPRRTSGPRGSCAVTVPSLCPHGALTVPSQGRDLVVRPLVGAIGSRARGPGRRPGR